MFDRKTYMAIWRTNNRENIRQYDSSQWHYRQERKFGVSYPTFWLCDICSKPISGHNLVLDHNHITNEFRGWLCVWCNATLGTIEKIGFSQFGAYLFKWAVFTPREKSRSESRGTWLYWRLARAIRLLQRLLEKKPSAFTRKGWRGIPSVDSYRPGQGSTQISRRLKAQES